MGMSSHVIGFRGRDAEWDRMEAVWNACETAGVPIPDEVKDFFGHESPRDRPGIDVELGSALSEWRDDARAGYELDLSKLPPGLRIVRFYNAW